MKTLGKRLKWLSKFIAHGLVIGIPVIALWGALFPWPPAEQCFSGLAKSAHIFVGMKVNYALSSTQGVRTESHSYLIVSPHPGWPKLVTVSQTDKGPPKISNPSVLGFFLFLGTYAFAVYNVWRTWFRRVPVQDRGADPSPQPSPSV
jgi:hypothetical protein